MLITNKDRTFKNYEIVSADFKTITYKSQHFPVSIGWKSSKGYNYFYVNKVNLTTTNEEGTLLQIQSNSTKIVTNFFNSLFSTNWRDKTPIIYFHNGSNFDFLFLLKTIENSNLLKKMDVISRNGVFYQIRFILEKKIFGKTVCKVFTFKDSLHLFSLPLSKLASLTGFDSKIDFDHTRNIIENINDSDYKRDLLFYIKRDVDILYQVLIDFRKILMKTEEIDICSYISASSLTLNTFLTHYYEPEKNLIHTLNREMDSFIREGYYGGCCEVYKPYLGDIIVLDVNSLYPTIIENIDIPVGPGKWVSSKVELESDDFFGNIV